jgi:DNA-binding NarL/FixJ family response regulator
MSKPRVLLADDHSLFREGLRQLLADRVEVVGAVGDGRSLLVACKELQPDLVLLDISMPQLNGFDAAQQLRRTSPQLRFIFVTMHLEPDYVKTALGLGASGYVVKCAASTELLTAIDAALRDEVFVSPEVSRAAPDGSDDLRTGPLTPRQREVLQLVAEGWTAREIAVLLTLSRKTVEYHKGSIMRLLDLHSTPDLTRYALDHGFLVPA